MLTRLDLPSEDFLRIVSGGPAGAAVERLRAGAYSRRILRIVDALDAAQRQHRMLPDEVAGEVLDLLDAARRTLGSEPAALVHPSSGLWALKCAANEAPVAHLASIAACAGVEAGLEFELDVPVHPEGVVLPGIGVWRNVSAARADRGRARVSGGDGHWEIRAASQVDTVPGLRRSGVARSAASATDAWDRPLPFGLGASELAGSGGVHLGPGWAPAIEWADPYLELPRAGSGFAVRGAVPAVFLERLGEAWELLVRRHPDRAADLAAAVEVIVPLRRAGEFERLGNASSPDAFGAVWLDADAPAVRIAAALVHELEHIRLAAVHDLEPLHGETDRTVYAVPWRPDPRPVYALLQGLFAHVGTAEFWAVEAACGRPGAQRLLERCRGAAREALRGFDGRGALSRAGLRLLEGVETRLERLGATENRKLVQTMYPDTADGSSECRSSHPEESKVEAEETLATIPAPAAETAPGLAAVQAPTPGGTLAIVHASMDRMWAEWVREQYEHAGHATRLVRFTRMHDVSIAGQMREALDRYDRVAVLFSSRFMVGVSGSDAEWAEAIEAARAADRRVIPVLVGRCALPGGFWQLEPVSLFGVKDEEKARHWLLRRAGLPEEHGADARPQVAFLRFPGREPVLVNDVPVRNAEFTGRREHLDAIRDGLAGNRVALVPHTLQGLGGVGKTELAIEYAHRFGCDYDVVWWIRAESRATMREALAELGARLGADPAGEIGECVRYALDALRQGEPYARWLVVFDNAEDIEDALQLLPKPSESGHVLITSRNIDWRLHGQSVEVDLYPRHESLEFLRRKAPRISVEDSNGLAEAVQDLPLALDHAASWYLQTGGSAKEYRELMEAAFDSFHEQTAEFNRRHNVFETVATTWLVNFNTLRENERTRAGKLLELLAFFAPVPVHVELIRRVPDGMLPPELEQELRDPQMTSEMIRAVTRLSLVKMHPQDHDQRQALEMHSLVQMFVSGKVSVDAAGRYRRAVRHALAAARPQDPTLPGNYSAYVEVIPHLRPAGAMESMEPEIRKLVLDTCRSLLQQGEFLSCERLVARSLTAWSENLDPADDDLLILRRCESMARGGLGDQAGRLRINEDIYRLAVQARGEQDERALRTRGGIASALLQLGRVREAEDIGRSVLEATRAKYGEDSPETLRAMYNYALNLRLASRYAEALELDQAVYSKGLEVFGSEHADTLNARTSVACDLRELGRYFEAAYEQEDNYAACVSVLGQGSPATLRAMMELAVIRRRTGRYEEAFEIGRLALERHAAHYAEDHPEYISALTNFAGDCRFVGDVERGAKLAREACERAHRILPAPHPIRAATATNLAVFARGAGDLDEATRLDTGAFEELVEVLGEVNNYTLACEINLANDAAVSGDLAEAQRLHEHAWRHLVDLRGPDHSHTALAKANLTLTQLRLGQVDRAHLVSFLRQVGAAEADAGSGLTAFERDAIAAHTWLDCDLDLPMY